MRFRLVVSSFAEASKSDSAANFGGAQRSTTLLCGQLQKTNKVEVIDA